MLEALQPTQDPAWVLTHEGYNVLTESAVESRFAFGNGFLGMRAARSFSRGPTWSKGNLFLGLGCGRKRIPHAVKGSVRKHWVL